MLWNCVVRCSLCVIYFYQFYIVRRYLEIGSVAMLTVRRNEFQFHIYLSALIWSSCKPKRRRCRAHSNFNNFFFSHPHNLVSIFPTKPRELARTRWRNLSYFLLALLFFSALLTSNLLAGFRANRDLAGNCVQMTNQLTVRVRPTHKKKIEASRSEVERRKIEFERLIAFLLWC